MLQLRHDQQRLDVVFVFGLIYLICPTHAETKKFHQKVIVAPKGRVNYNCHLKQHYQIEELMR